MIRVKGKLKLLSLVLWITSQCIAHPLDLGLLNIHETYSKIEVRLELNPILVTQLTDSAQKLFDATLKKSLFIRNDEPCAWDQKIESQLTSPQNFSLTAILNCPNPQGKLSGKLFFLSQWTSTFRLLVRSQINGDEFLKTLDPAKIEFSIEPPPSLGEFAWMGIEHIGMTPTQWNEGGRLRLPDGIDHILFVLALVLCGGSLLATLKTITGFTLGHSLTLVLASFGVIELPSRLVESLIALSICVVAFEALFLKDPKTRWKIAIAFGLVHGMGFASALAELNLDQKNLIRALIGFNLGVEVGQAAIVAIALPILTFIQRTVLQVVFIPTSASAIFLTGGYWFIRRAFGF